MVLGLYTGSRPGAILSAAWDRGPGRSRVDVERGVFHRHAEGKSETNKRQPTAKAAPRLKAHCERWRRQDGGRGQGVTFNGGRVASVKTALARAVKIAGLDAGAIAYTLLHSCASGLVAKGLPTRKVVAFSAQASG